MKVKLIIVILSCISLHSIAQPIFIDKAEVIYEVRTNFHKTRGNSTWEENIKENMPEFKTYYYKLTFANNQSIYKFDHWHESSMRFPEWLRRDDEENIWYTDVNTGIQQRKRQIWGTEFNLQDSLRKVQWRFTNENREIAGFNCRKAVGIINDSVYVFAFYTNDITFTGGPLSFNGLPGLIMGITIPRLYTSWVATSVAINNVNTSVIKPLKFKKTYTVNELNDILTEKMKDWWDDDEGDTKKQKNILQWNLLL